jgi:hypothetical protein
MLSWNVQCLDAAIPHLGELLYNFDLQRRARADLPQGLTSSLDGNWCNIRQPFGQLERWAGNNPPLEDRVASSPAHQGETELPGRRSSPLSASQMERTRPT